MDYLVGFIFGYFIKDIYVWLDKLANKKNNNPEEWDWISYND